MIGTSMLRITASRIGAAALLLALFTTPAAAQGSTWSEAWVGSEAEIYLRALAINGALPGGSWSIRPFAPALLERWAGDSAVRHPWAPHLRTSVAGGGFTLLRPSATLSYNSAIPWGFDDGAVWQGKGANAWVTAGATWRRGPLSIRLEPVAFVAQNAPFDLLPLNEPNPSNPFLDPQRPNQIDLPQRFGAASYRRVELGQSHIRLDALGVAFGMSTENVFWGPAVRNPLLLGPNAAGFPHLFIGSSTPVRTPLGRVHGQLLYGQLAQSAYASQTRNDGKRLGSGFALSWMPPASDAIELGVTRFYHHDWPTRLGLSDLAIPFGGIGYQPLLDALGTKRENQLLTVFARTVSTSAGIELFGEFGKNDRNADVRDALVEPDHNSAWSLGLLKTIGAVTSSEFWTLRGEVVDGRVTSLQRFRGQSTFYEHFTLTEGHTERGQLLGTPLLERAGGVELSVDRWNAAGRVGAMLTQRTMPPDLQEGSASSASRSQWALELNGTRFRAHTDLSWRAGVLLDLDRTPGHDGRSLFLGGGIRPGR